MDSGYNCTNSVDDALEEDEEHPSWVSYSIRTGQSATQLIL